MPPEHEELKAAVAESAALTRSVEGLTTALVDAAEENAKRWRKLSAFLAVLVVISITAYWFQYQRLTRGMRCVLSEQAAHRIDNRASHSELADAHHVHLPAELGIPIAPSHATISEACRPFYEFKEGRNP